MLSLLGGGDQQSTWRGLTFSISLSMFIVDCQSEGGEVGGWELSSPTISMRSTGSQLGRTNGFQRSIESEFLC